jgi:hypothetical protein
MRQGEIIIMGIAMAIIAGVIFGRVVAVHNNLESYKPYATYTRLIHIASGCDKYEEQTGAWPSSLAQLLNGHPEFSAPWDKDTWGREVILLPYNESIGYGEVISYGRDGKPGGVGLDKDLIVRFPAQSNADWNKQQGVGLPKP